MVDRDPDRIPKTAIRKNTKKEDIAAARGAGLLKRRNVRLSDNVLEKKNRSRSRDEKKKKSKKRHYRDSESD